MKITIHKRPIIDALISAIDTGIHHWGSAAIAGGTVWLDKKGDLPRGGIPIFERSDDDRAPDDTEHRLDWKKIEAGLQLLADCAAGNPPSDAGPPLVTGGFMFDSEHAGRVLGEVLCGFADAESSDVFVQVCLFRDVRYG